MTRAGLVLALLAAGCAPSGYEEGEELAGGDTTVFDSSEDAYTRPAANLSFEETGTFEVGNNFNGDNWVVAPASTLTRDGLGPVYNATSCSACHSHDGRGQPPGEDEEMLSMLIRLSVPGMAEDGGPLPEPSYGGQLQPRSIPGVPPEAETRVTWEEIPGSYGDGTSYSLRRPMVEIRALALGPMQEGAMTSVRVAPPQYGLGLLEAVPEADLMANADPDDSDGDGISGRPNHVWDVEAGAVTIGRFGWKANVPSVRQQTAGALHGDIGITSSLFGDQSCTAAETDCVAAPDGGAPEATDQVLDAMVFYGRTLAVPGRRDVHDAEVLRGRALFRELGCADCHVPSFTTGQDDIAALSHQRIWPYTDLLLHDMGEELADHRPDYEATGTEWRTPPLWGIGLLETVNHHQFLLHDGRARGLAEAILWHGGEAEAAREAFRTSSADERSALLSFLGSL